MTNPYQPPRAKEGTNRQLFLFGVALLVIAIALPIHGAIGTIAQMMHSFNELSEAEMPSPDSLAGGISLSPETTVIGLALGVKEHGPDSVGVLVPALIIEGIPGVIATL